MHIQVVVDANYDTPFTKKLNEFANLYDKVVGTIYVLVWLVKYKYDISWDVENNFPINFEFNFEQITYC